MFIYIHDTEKIANCALSGFIGIGTNDPSDKLEVKNGNIRITGGSFINNGTTLKMPDYVFEEDYPLMTLLELEAYIAREKRLPNVPSAREIKKQGLNMSQFQMRLLEKIEELTLYTIAQGYEIEALKEQLRKMRPLDRSLKTDNAALKERIAEIESEDRELSYPYVGSSSRK